MTRTGLSDYVPIPRWSLVLKYILFTVCGLVALIFGSHTLSSTTEPDYSIIWSIVVMASAASALAGVLWPKQFWLEALGAAVLIMWTFIIAILAVIASNELFAAYLLLAISMPLGRLSVLSAQMKRSLHARRIQ